MAAPRTRVLAGYKEMLRAINHAFKGDSAALRFGKQELRTAVLLCKDERDPVKLEELIQGFSEASTFLRQNIVQGRLNDSGNYEVKLDPSHANEKKVIELDTDPASAKPHQCCGGGCS